MASQGVVQQRGRDAAVGGDDAGAFLCGGPQVAMLGGEAVGNFQGEGLRPVHGTDGGRGKGNGGVLGRCGVEHRVGCCPRAGQPGSHGGRAGRSWEVCGPGQQHQIVGVGGRRVRCGGGGLCRGRVVRTGSGWLWGGRNRAGARAGLLWCVGQQQVTVGAAEAEGGHARDAASGTLGGGPGLRCGRDTQGAQRAGGTAEVRLGGDDRVAQCEQRVDCRDGSGRPTGVSHHGLGGGAGPAAAGGQGAEGIDLGAVPRPGTGGVGDDPVDVLREDAPLLACAAHRPGLARRVGCGDGTAPAVACGAEARQDA